MKNKLIIIILLSYFVQAQAQRINPDEIKTSKGVITIQPIVHATMVLTSGNQTIYVDPTGGAEAFKGLKAPDLILITDIHPDHLDPKTLEAINTAGATWIVPPAVAEKLPQVSKDKMVILKNGEKTEQRGITIKAIPMYNLPKSANAFHPKGRGNGYVISTEGKNIYISGDTADIPEMRALKKIDIAFVCMNLPYTMSIKQAAEGVLAFKPKIVYPYHYRGQNGFSDVEGFKKLVNEGDKQIEVRLRNWYPNTNK